MNILRKTISLLCVLLIMLSATAAIPAAAADMATIYANDVAAYKGNTVSVSINAENLNNVGSLDIEVYYDSSAVTLKEIKNGSLVSGCLVSTNKDVVGDIEKYGTSDKVTVMNYISFTNSFFAYIFISCKLIFTKKLFHSIKCSTHKNNS